MKQWIIAALMTLTAICAGTGAPAAAPAASAVPVAAAPAAADAPEYGGCRWQCATTGTFYLTSAKCQAACSTVCVEIC